MRKALRQPKPPTLPKPKAIELDLDMVPVVERELLDDLQRAAASMSDVLLDITRWRKHYSDRVTEKPPYKGASMLLTPYVKGITYGIHADISNAVLNPDPILNLQANGQAALFCEPMQAFYQQFCTQYTDFAAMFRYGLWCGLRDSYAPYMLTHEYESLAVWAWELSQAFAVDEDGVEYLQARRKRVRQERVVYDEARLLVIPPEDFFVIPAQNADIDRALGVGARFTVTGADLYAGVRAKQYDGAIVEEVLGAAGADDRAQSTEDKLRKVVAQDPSDMGDDYSNRVVTLAEVYRRYYPDKDKPGEEWLFTIDEHTGRVLRAKQSPVNTRPFAVFRPYMDGPGLAGDSVASTGASGIEEAKQGLMRAAVRIANRRINGRTYVPNGQFNDLEKKVGRNAKDAYTQDNAVIPISDTAWEKGQFPKPVVDANDGREALSLNEVLNQEGTLYHHYSETQQNAQSKPGTTATEIQLMLDNSKKYIGLMVERAAMPLQRLGRILHEDCQLHAESERLQTWYAEVNADNDVPWDMAVMADYRITANGMSQTSSKALKERQAMDALQLAMSIPQIAENPARIVPLLQNAFGSLGVRPPEKATGTVEEWQQEQMAQQQAMMAQQAMQAEQQQQAQQAKQANGDRDYQLKEAQALAQLMKGTQP